MKRLTLLLALALVACGGSTEPTTVYGSYTLQTINGSKPPVVRYADNSTSISVTGAAITIRQDGTFSWTRTEHNVCSTCGADDSITENGTYTQTGSDFTMTYVTLRVYTYFGTWSGRSFTMTTPAVFPGDIALTYVFTR